MAEVSTSSEVVYQVKQMISKPVGVVSDTKQRIQKTVALEYATRESVIPAKVLSLEYDIRVRSSRSTAVVYGVRVPVAVGTGGAFSLAFSSAFDSEESGPSGVSVKYDVRVRITKSIAVQYDVLATGSTTMSKSLVVRYHTLVIADPSIDGLITVPINPDSTPPQITTTSF